MRTVSRVLLLVLTFSFGVTSLSAVAQQGGSSNLPQVVEVAQSVSQGMLLHKVQPIYPLLARQAGVQGTVVLSVLIGEDGSVMDLKLISGHPMLFGAALNAVKQWRYRPYVLDGVPVRVKTQASVNFALSPDHPRQPTGPPSVSAQAEAPDTGSWQPASEVVSLMNHLPSSYSGLSFFGGKLYAGTNIGLLLIEDDHVTQLRRFHSTDSAVSGPWVDVADNLLWVMDEHTEDFLSFDGATWKRVPRPTPQKGYYSRGDVLEGVRLLGNTHGFWLAAAGSVWRWDKSKGNWQLLLTDKEQQTADYRRQDVVIGVLPVGEKVLLLKRHERGMHLVKPEQEFYSDTVSAYEDQSRELPNRAGGFYADTWAAAAGAGYICTKDHRLLRVTPDGITELKAPAGGCETVATGKDDVLLTCISRAGIFKYDGHDWTLMAKHPNPSDDGKYSSFVAENDSSLAYAMGFRLSVKENNAPAALWIAHDTQFHPVAIQ